VKRSYAGGAIPRLVSAAACVREPRHVRFCEIWVYWVVDNLELLRLFGSMVYFTAHSWRLLRFERAGERCFGLFTNGCFGIIIYHISFV
jgi:hypothetical protein